MIGQKGLLPQPGYGGQNQGQDFQTQYHQAPYPTPQTIPQQAKPQQEFIPPRSLIYHDVPEDSPDQPQGFPVPQQFGQQQQDIQPHQYGQLEIHAQQNMQRKQLNQQQPPINIEFSTSIAANENQIKSLSAGTRLPFIRKVYSILFTQILITFLMIVISAAQESYRTWQKEKNGLLIIVSIIWMILLYALSCYQKVNRIVPLNYICLFVFTLCNGYLVSHTCAYYPWETLVIAGSLTLGMFFGLTGYAFYTKQDLTIKYGLLWTMSWSLFAGIIIGSIIRDYWVSMIVSFFGVIVFSIYLI